MPPAKSSKFFEALDAAPIIEDTAPKTSRTRAKATPKTRTPKAVIEARALHEPLVDLYSTIGVFTKLKNPHVGDVIIEQASECADSLVALAEKNQSVARALSRLTQASAMGGVITAHMPIVMALFMSRQLSQTTADDDLVDDYNAA